MYLSDSTYRQWSRLEPLLEETRRDRHAGGTPRKYKQRRVVDGMLYAVKTGSQWRQLRAIFPFGGEFTSTSGFGVTAVYGRR